MALPLLSQMFSQTDRDTWATQKQPPLSLEQRHACRHISAMEAQRKADICQALTYALWQPYGMHSEVGNASADTFLFCHSFPHINSSGRNLERCMLNLGVPLPSLAPGLGFTRARLERG